jgi:hypothetical protein
LASNEPQIFRRLNPTIGTLPSTQHVGMIPIHLWCELLSIYCIGTLLHEDMAREFSSTAQKISTKKTEEFSKLPLGFPIICVAFSSKFCGIFANLSCNKFFIRMVDSRSTMEAIQWIVLDAPLSQGNVMERLEFASHVIKGHPRIRILDYWKITSPFSLPIWMRRDGYLGDDMWLKSDSPYIQGKNPSFLTAKVRLNFDGSELILD